MFKLRCNFCFVKTILKKWSNPLYFAGNSFYLTKLIASYILGLLLLSSSANADYAAKVNDPSRGTYISLNVDATIATDPVRGTDGKLYYQVGNRLEADYRTEGVEVSGSTKCWGTLWGNTESADNDLPAENAWHRIFMSAPRAGFYINSLPAYRINANLVLVIESQYLEKWGNESSRFCTGGNGPYGTVNQSMALLTAQFPIYFTFYINELVVDGTLPVPAMDIGGYVRAFTIGNTTPPQTSWAISESSVPMRLRASQLNLVSSCTTTTSSGGSSLLNIEHGNISSAAIDSTATAFVYYECKFSALTNVRLKLDYTKDDDPAKRLPMYNTVNSNNKIYSKLTITDGVSEGTEIKVSIDKLKTIKIISHIQGTTAIAGNYKGTAWLIATFD